MIEITKLGEFSKGDNILVHAEIDILLFVKHKDEDSVTLADVDPNNDLTYHVADFGGVLHIDGIRTDGDIRLCNLTKNKNFIRSTSELAEIT